MKSLVIAVGLFIPSVFGVDTEEKEDVPELCNELEDKDSNDIQLIDDPYGVIPTETVATCETHLINKEFNSLNNIISDIKEDKNSIEEELKEEKQEKDKLTKEVKSKSEEIKQIKAEYEDKLEQERIQKEKERKAKEKAQAKKEQEKVVASKETSKPAPKKVKSTPEPKKDKSTKEPKKESSNDTPKSSNKASSIAGSFEVTYYTAFCDTGCTGQTATGLDVSNTTTHNGHGIIATDPSVIPMGTVVEMDGSTYIAQDSGGDIKGNRIDILTSSKSKARDNGRHNAEVKIIN